MRGLDSPSESKPADEAERPFWQKVLIGALLIGLAKFIIAVISGDVK